MNIEEVPVDGGLDNQSAVMQVGTRVWGATACAFYIWSQQLLRRYDEGYYSDDSEIDMTYVFR